MSLLSCCRSAASSKHDLDDHHYYSSAYGGNPRRTFKPKSNVVASSESLGPPKSTNFNAYDDTKVNQFQDCKSPREVAFMFNAGSTESTVVTSSDLYNRTDNPVTVAQWMNIFEEAKNQQNKANSSQSTTASSTCVGSNDRLTLGASTTSIDDDDDDDDDDENDGSQSSSRRLPAMQSLGVLPTRPVTLSRPSSHIESGANELEKSHSVSYLSDNAVAARESQQMTPHLLRSPEVEDVRKEQTRIKFNVQRSPELQDLSHIESDPE